MAFKDKATKKWTASIYYTDINGEKKRTRKKGFPTKKEAIEYENMYKDTIIQKNDEVNVNFIKFGELCQSYISSLKGTLKPTTISRYETAIKLFEPLYKTKVTLIDTKLITKWQQSLLDKYAVRTINNAKVVMGAVFDYGIDNFDLINNPTKRVKRLKDFKVNDEIDYINLEDYLKFESVIDDVVWKSFFMFLFYTGTRRGEALAITWNDIDFDTKLLKINKTLNNKTKGQNYIISRPKTANSKRQFLLPDRLMEQLILLKDHYSQFEGYNSQWFVFGGMIPLKDSTIERRKNKYFKLASIRQIKIHDFRHSHASLLINSGVRMDVVQKRLGHASIQTTIDYYGALYQQSNDEATEMLNNL